MDDTHSDTAEIELCVKATRIGKLLTFADSDAKGGTRSMTDAELQVHDYMEELVEAFDTEKVKPGHVGTVRFDSNGDPSVEWHRNDAAEADGLASNGKQN